MELPKLDKFKSLVQQLAEENELDIADMAAALAFENQKERPLFPKLETIKAPPSRERERDSKRDRNKDRGERKEHRGQKSEGRDSRREQDTRPKRDAVRQEADNVRDGVKMVTYRLEVGNNDKITPSNIVGAIANEADIDSRYIGEIKLHDDHSTVDLPEGMPKELLNHLKKVRVCAKPMRISVLGEGSSGSHRNKSDPMPEPRAPRKRKFENDEKKTISRNVKNKRTAGQAKTSKTHI